MVWLVLQTQLPHTLSFPCLHWFCQWVGQGLFCSSVLQWNAILPLCWPSFMFSLQEPPHSQEATKQQLPVWIFKCFLTPHLLNKDTKSIHEHTACLNIFVAIKYMKKCPKHAIIPYIALWPYYIVKPSTVPQAVLALKIYFLNNTSLESSTCQQILTYSSPVEFTFYHHLVVYKFSCHSSLQIISCTCG